MKKQKRILFVAPSSFPINGPEAMVNAKHVLLLCNMGYSVDLICRSARVQTDIYPIEKELPHFYSKVDSIRVISVKTAWNFDTLIRHLKAYLKTGYVYKASDWSFDAICYCEKKLKMSDYDYIFTKDYPSEIVGLYFAKKLGIKWIPTWNDPYMWKKYPEPYGKGANCKISYLRKCLIKDIGRYSYINLFPCDRLRDYMLYYMTGLRKESCVIMPHILIRNNEGCTCHSKENGNELKIIHAGSIGKERNPELFLLALKRFVESSPTKKIKVHFLGVVQRTSSTDLMKKISSLGLDDIVSFQKPVPYEESLEIVKQYDVSLVIEAPCKEGIFLPSKVIDYLQNENPIFAISPLNGTLSDLHRKGVIDFFADVVSVDSIYNALEEIYTKYLLGFAHNKKQLEEFEMSNVMSLHQQSILI